MPYRPIAIIYVPAIGSPNGWIRTAKTIYISKTAPIWMVRLIDEWGSR